jgi:hypothetical protein
MNLKELFKRRKVVWVEDFEAIKGPYGYIRHDGTKLGVVVDITSTKLQRRTEQALGPVSGYTLTNDGEYLFRLDFSDTNTALALIGLRAKAQRE